MAVSQSELMPLLGRYGWRSRDVRALCERMRPLRTPVRSAPAAAEPANAHPSALAPRPATEPRTARRGDQPLTTRAHGSLTPDSRPSRPKPLRPRSRLPAEREPAAGSAPGSIITGRSPVLSSEAYRACWPCSQEDAWPQPNGPGSRERRLPWATVRRAPRTATPIGAPSVAPL